MGHEMSGRRLPLSYWKGNLGFFEPCRGSLLNPHYVVCAAKTKPLKIKANGYVSVSGQLQTILLNLEDLLALLF